MPPTAQQATGGGTSPAAAPLDQLYAPTTLPGTSIRIRLPQSLKTVFNKASKVGGQPVPPARLSPPFALPGFSLCYEGSATLGSRRYPFYCYLAVVAGDYRGPEGESLEQALAEGVSADTEGAASWETTTCPTPGGGELTCRRLQSEGAQPFYLSEEAADEQLDGWLEIYIVPLEEQQLIVVWRAPTELLEQTQLARLAPVSVGTTTAGAGG